MDHRRHDRRPGGGPLGLVVLAALFAGALLLIVPPSAARASESGIRFGIGGGVGDPFGPSLKLFLHQRHALQFDLGWAPMHHGDGITHLNYLFHLSPFVEHDVFDFGLYFGAGVGMAFWAPPPSRRCYYDRRGRYVCDGVYRDHGRGGVAMIARAPVGVYFHFRKIPIDAVVEGGWSPYVYHWDPYHGDVSAKVRYYFR